MGMQMTGSNSIFSVPPEHLPGLMALIAFPLVAWCVVAAIHAGDNRGSRLAQTMQSRLDATSFAGRVALAAMLVGAVVHAAIIPTHWGDSRVLAILFVADAVGFVVASVWLVLQRAHWRLAAIAMLGGTFAGYVFYLLKGWETPDPVGLLTTGIELTGALVLLMPAHMRSGAPVGRRWALTAAVPVAAITMLGAAALAGVPSSTSDQASAATTHAATGAMGAMGGMAGMGAKHPSGTSTGSSDGSMPSMSSMPAMANSSSAQPNSTMPGMSGMTGSSGASASGDTMPGMTGMSNPSTGSMPGMGGGSGDSTGAALFTGNEFSRPVPSPGLRRWERWAQGCRW